MNEMSAVLTNISSDSMINDAWWKRLYLCIVYIIAEENHSHRNVLNAASIENQLNEIYKLSHQYFTFVFHLTKSLFIPYILYFIWSYLSEIRLGCKNFDARLFRWDYIILVMYGPCIKKGRKWKSNHNPGTTRVLIARGKFIFKQKQK